MTMDLEKNLKKPQKLFVTSAVVMIVMLAVYAGLRKVEEGYQARVSKLKQVQANLVLMQQCATELKSTTTTLSSLVPAAMDQRTPENIVYAKLDEIKSQLPKAQMTISGIDEKPDELRLPFSVKVIEKNDYTAFINGLGRIQSSVLPAVAVKNVVIAQADEQGKRVVTLTLEGTVIVPKNQ